MANLGYLQLTRACYQGCRFCSNPPTGVELTAEAMRAEIDHLAELGYDGIILTGGEPSISPLLFEALTHATSRGLRNRMITNGQMLADRDFFARCVDAGLEHVHFSLHSHRREVHDFITRYPGAFDRLTDAMTHVPHVGLTADVNTVICTYNADHLDVAARWIVREFPFVQHFVWNNMDPDGNRAEENPDCIAKHREFSVSLHHAMDFLHRSGRTFRAERVPLCFMPAFPHASTETRKIVKEEERCIRFLDGKGFVRQREFLHGKGDACDVCRWDPICAGMYSMAKTYDERELSPVFEDPEPVIRAVLGREPEGALSARILARAGRRSQTEQPDPEQRRRARLTVL